MAYFSNDQVIDHQPGHYYVTIVDGPRYWFLLGPFPRHMGALLKVAAAKKKAPELDPKTWFYGFGTARLPLDIQEPPKSNAAGPAFAGRPATLFLSEETLT